jgi:hypothetical protein
LPSWSVILTKSHRGGTRKYSIVAIFPIASNSDSNVFWSRVAVPRRLVRVLVSAFCPSP